MFRKILGKCPKKFRESTPKSLGKISQNNILKYPGKMPQNIPGKYPQTLLKNIPKYLKIFQANTPRKCCKISPNIPGKKGPNIPEYPGKIFQNIPKISQKISPKISKYFGKISQKSELGAEFSFRIWGFGFRDFLGMNPKNPNNWIKIIRNWEFQIFQNGFWVEKLGFPKDFPGIF